jgi:hypothetical protein
VPNANPGDLSDLSDEDLDRYILVRLQIAGVDLSVLPDEVEAAPADRTRILVSARNFLRATLPAIAQLSLEPGEAIPALYPTHLLRSDPDAR